MRIKNLLLLPLLVCGLFIVTTQVAAKNPPGDIDGAQQFIYKDSLRNAFELVRILQNLDTTKVDKERYQILLGKLLWYANLQDSTNSDYGVLLKKLNKKYPALYQKATVILSKLNPIEKLFTLRDLSIYKQITSTAATEFVKGHHERYKILKDKLTDQKKRARGIVDQIDKLSEIIDSKRSKADTGGVHNTAFSGGWTEDSTSLSEAIVRVDVADSLIDTTYSLMLLEKDSIVVYVHDHIGEFTDLFKKLYPQNEVGSDAYSNSGLLAEDALKLAENQYSMQVTYQMQIQAPSVASYKMPSQSEMVDAVAIYIARRVKQESVMWFFESVSKNANRYDMMRAFFPATLTLMGGNEVYEIPNMGTPWKYALSEDFTRLPQNVMNSKWIKDRWPEQGKYMSFIKGTCSIADLLMHQKSYREIIRSLYLEQKQVTQADSNVQFSDFVNLLYAVNTELFVPADSNKFTGLLKYEHYSTLNKTGMEMLVSLIDMKYGGVMRKFIKGMDRRIAFSSDVSAEDIRLLFGKIETMVNDVEATRKTFIEQQKNTKEDGGNDAKSVAYTTYNVWNATNSLLTVFDQTVNPSPIFSQRLNASKKAFQYTTQLFEIYNLIDKKNFTGAVMLTFGLLDSIIYGHSLNKKFNVSIANEDELQRKFGSSSILKHIVTKIRKDTADHEGLKNLEDLYGFTVIDSTTISFPKTSLMASVLFEQDRHAVQVIRKLAGFLNDVALSKGSAELSKAIESYAMPPGSYKRKRNSWWSADINAFAGPYLGSEVLAGQDFFESSNRSSVYGFSVPIGVTLSKTLGRPFHSKSIDKEYILNPNKIKLNRRRVAYRTKSTFSLTLSIVDIGAVVSYRLNNGSGTLPQELKWEQFISPGLHIGYGIGGTPLILQAGYQYTPLLRRLSTSPDPSAQYNAYRLYIGLFYDLPIINMWEKKRIVY